MDLFVLRNKDAVDKFYDLLRQRRLPCKVMVDDIYPKRSVDGNAYLWGVVYEAIACASGHSAEEVHKTYKERWNFRGDFRINPETKQYEYVAEVGSTASLNSKYFWDYVFKVRCDGELFHNIIIELPSESFIEPLVFEFENTVKKKRL